MRDFLQMRNFIIQNREILYNINVLCQRIRQLEQSEKNAFFN